jgi:hypothetical protein
MSTDAGRERAKAAGVRFGRKHKLDAYEQPIVPRLNAYGRRPPLAMLQAFSTLNSRPAVGHMMDGSQNSRPPDTQKQRPQRGLAGVLYARIPHGRLGGGGLESARHLLTLSRIAFGICIK